MRFKSSLAGKTFGLLVASLCVLAGCGSHAAPDEDSDAAAKPTVTLTRVTRSDISRTVALTGTAAAPPNRDVRVSSLVPGRISELRVAEGDEVKAGEVVARIDDRTFAGQVEQALASLDQAKANLDNVKLARARDEDLFGRGIVARKELEDARTQESVAEATLKQAQAALDLAHVQLARCAVSSPLTGLVAKRFVSVGEQVDGTAAQPIVEVASLGEVEFLASVPDAYLTKLRSQESVEVTSDISVGMKFPGHVIAISPAVDPATGVGLVRIGVPNPKGLLRLGVFLTAEIPIDTHRHVLTVPAESIYRDEAGEPRVFVVDKDSATAVPVEIGIESESQAEIEPKNASDLKEGAAIIRSGGYGLADKATVEVEGSREP